MRAGAFAATFLLVACVGQGPDDGVTVDGGIAVPDAGGPGAPDAANPADTGTAQPSCYSEPVDPDADIADLIASYGGSNWKDELIAAMSLRHPASGWLLDAQRNDSYFNQFSDSQSWTGMVGWLDTLSHEETHLFNAYHAQAQGQVHALYHHSDLIYYLPSDPGFARAEIYDDMAQVARDGIYGGTYFTGSSGQRGFNALLDEHNCYLNEMAAVGTVGEHFDGGVSLRDGSVAFLYFLELYLRVARTEYPAIYAQLQSAPVYQDAVETAWLRTHFFFEIADDYPNLGVSDAAYLALAHEPDNMAEISMFIGKTVTASACIP